MKYIYKFFCGRSTFLALVILAIGSTLAFMGKLDSSFIALAGVIQSMVVARAISEDHQGKRADWHKEDK